MPPTTNPRCRHSAKHALAFLATIAAAVACISSNASAQSIADNILRIDLNAPGQMLADGQLMSLEQLETSLRSIPPPSEALLRVGEDVDIKRVTELMDLLKRANVTKVRLQSRFEMVQPPPEPGVNIDFPGGTVGQLLDLLGKDKNQRFNLIAEKPQRELVLPAFSVRNANPHSLAQALDKLVQKQNMTVTTFYSPRNQTAEPVFYLVSRDTQPRLPASETRSYAIGDLLDRYSAEDISSALRAAWELDPANDPTALRIKFHPETNLLFVVGPIAEGRGGSDALRLTDQVIGNLARQPKPSPESPAPASSPSR